jgi:hypothetical protein
MKTTLKTAMDTTLIALGWVCPWTATWCYRRLTSRLIRQRQNLAAMRESGELA